MAQRKSYNHWWLLGSIAVACVPFFLYLYLGGWVYGEEFSPDDFSRRRFSYNVTPFFDITVKGIRYNDSTPVFEQTLFADGFIGQSAPVKRWHLIHDSVSDLGSADFDARLLTRFLDLQDENNESIWITWNENHPELAIKFWSIIADLAREHLYLAVADVMQKAIGIGENDVASFEAVLKEISSDALCRKAYYLLDDNKFDAAIDCFTKSIDITPTKDALEGRAKAYESIGQNDKSAADLETASKSENL